MGYGLLILEVSRSPSDTPQSVATPLDESSARRRNLYLATHNTHNRQTSMPPGGILNHNLSRRAAADLRLRPRGHWDRLIQYLFPPKNMYTNFLDFQQTSAHYITNYVGLLFNFQTAMTTKWQANETDGRKSNVTENGKWQRSFRIYVIFLEVILLRTL